MVIGSGGAGKSTFSRRLGRLTGLPVIHLDSIFWRPNWERTPEAEWEAKVRELAAGDAWIMDGNFGGTREIRLRAADTVILLDIPRLTCIYRIFKRVIMYRGKSRPDMAEGCKEKVDLEFFLWVWNYKNAGGKRAKAEISQLVDKDVVILRSSREIDQFLNDLSNDGVAKGQF